MDQKVESTAPMKVEFAKVLFDQYLFLKFVSFPMADYQRNRILFYEAVEVLLDNLRQDPELDFVCALDRLVYNNHTDNHHPQKRNSGVFPDFLTDHVQQICTTFLFDSASHPICIEEHWTKIAAFSASISPIPISIFDELLQVVLEKLLDSVFIEFALAELQIDIPSLEYTADFSKDNEDAIDLGPCFNEEDKNENAAGNWDDADNHSVSDSIVTELYDYDSGYPAHACTIQVPPQETTPTSPEPSGSDRNFQSVYSPSDLYLKAACFHCKRSMSVASKEMDISAIPSASSQLDRRCSLAISTDTAFEDHLMQKGHSTIGYLASPIEETVYEAPETLDRLLAKVKPVLMSAAKFNVKMNLKNPKAPLHPKVLDVTTPEDPSTYSTFEDSDQESADDDLYSDLGMTNTTSQLFPTMHCSNSPKSPSVASASITVPVTSDVFSDLEHFYAETLSLSIAKPRKQRKPRSILQKLKIPTLFKSCI